MINKNELKPNYSLFGGKGNVWNNTAHIYKNGTGNLCGTPALSTNHVRIEGVEVAGCQECCKLYKELEDEGPQFDGAGFSIEDRMQGWGDYMTSVDQDNQRYEDSHHCDDLDCNCSI